MPTLTEAASTLQRFCDHRISDRIAAIENVLTGADRQAARTRLSTFGVEEGLLDAALTIKDVAGQVNVLIHALGILMVLPSVLNQGERIISVSLGAGNTGKRFDLETTRRIAEFKFIHWKGGAEAIRQNALFKDFYLLAEHQTEKERELYVIGIDYPLRFLQSNRALSSVMSRNNRLWSDFQARYRGRFRVVSDYYSFRKDTVKLKDLIQYLPSLKREAIFCG